MGLRPHEPPPGLTAIDKHPYYGIKRFPASSVVNGIRPLDAFGRTDFTESFAADGGLLRTDRYVPRYDAFFPEYALSAIQTEHMVRDISPITTDVYGTPHGRRTGHGPTVWITEANLDPTGADPSNPDNPGGPPLGQLTAGDVSRLHAKAALRCYTAFANNGVSTIHLYAVKADENLALVDPSFFSSLKASGSAYPGDAAGGVTPRAVGRLAATLDGTVEDPDPHQVQLLEVADDHDHKQFEGDGTPAHPPLYDRDVVAFLPFQVTPGHFVASVYVMTRNMAKLHRPDLPEGDPRRRPARGAVSPRDRRPRRHQGGGRGPRPPDR